MGHHHHDKVSLEIARHVAAGLPDHPEWIALARKNLDNWTARNSSSPSLVRSYEEWRDLLDLPLAQLCDTLTAETDEGQRLRQSSPFAGALSPQTIWEIKQRLRDESTAA